MKGSVVDAEAAVAGTRARRQREAGRGDLEVVVGGLGDDAEAGDEVGDDFGAGGRETGTLV